MEKLKHVQAERRLKEAIELGIPDYEGKDADVELIKRKHRELTRRRMARVIQEEL